MALKYEKCRNEAAKKCAPEGKSKAANAGMPINFPYFCSTKISPFRNGK